MEQRVGGIGFIVAMGCAALTAVVLVLTALNARPAANAAVVLGYIPASLEYPYNVAVVRGFEAEAQRLGARVLVLDPRGDIQRQANAVDDLLERGVDGVAMLPLDAVIAQGWVDKIDERGIPVVSVVTQIGDPQTVARSEVYPKLVALVGMDDIIASTGAGALAARLLPAGVRANIAIIEGAPGYPQVWQRTQGFEQGLRAAGVRYTIVSSQPTDWTPERGEAVCQNVLSAHPNVDLIFSQADDMAIGCARALDAANSSVLLVATGGGSQLGVRAIREGEIDGSVCDNPYQAGVLSARALFEAVTEDQTPRGRLILVDAPAISLQNLDACPRTW